MSEETSDTMLNLEPMRHELAHAYMNVYVAIQIKYLREKRGWSQEELAKHAGLHQEQVSLLEQTRWKHEPTVEILRKVSRALDVRLRISFESFGSLVEEFLGMTTVSTPCSFDEDPMFHPSPEVKA